MYRISLLIILLVMAIGGPVAADDTHPVSRGTKDEALALVKKAVAYLKANGSEKALAAYNNPKGEFVDRDLYIFAVDLTGVTRANPVFPKLVGRNRLDEADADGKLYNRERNDLMKSNENFWMHYKFPDPITHTIMKKSQYCESIPDPNFGKLAICSGVYDEKP